MGRRNTIKWERSALTRPNNNIISSDFLKYVPYPWRFMEGGARIEYLLSNEYQRQWIDERNDWQRKMYPENTTVNVDVIKKYVMSFKTEVKPRTEEKKKPFKMKKFADIKASFDTKRPPEDPAMSFIKEWEDKKEMQRKRKERSKKKKK